MPVPVQHPIKDDELLYSRGVTVLKGPASTGYARLAKPYSVDVISCPGIRHPILTQDGHLNERDTERLLLKIRNIFRTAHAMGNDSLVLGALGCGAWRNPPEDVAHAFRRACEEYPDMFKKVVFAILPAPNARNYRAFECRLSTDQPSGQAQHGPEGGAKPRHVRS